MIKRSEAARIKLNQLAEKSNIRSFIFGVRGGGCSGFSYKFELISEELPDSRIFKFDKFQIIVDNKSYLFVNNTEIDWCEDIMGSKFIFNNPNVVSSCGCGESVD